MIAGLGLSPLLLFLLQAVIVIALPYGLWRFRGIHGVLPLVVVQIGLGVALGPSLLGRVAPALFAGLFPAASLTPLQGLVWLSVIFFAFLTGLHFDMAEIAGRGRAFAVTSLSSVLVPTVLGTAAGALLLTLEPGLSGAAATPGSFALAIGLASGVTALPVLGAILRELGMTQSRAGSLALGCAAVNDVALWIMVAGLLAMAGGRNPSGGLVTLAGLGGLAAFLAFAVRPLAAGMLADAVRLGRVNQRELVAICALMLLSAIATEALGVHAMVGAFAFGAVLPKTVARDLVERFESFVTVVLLPFFFISTGLSTQFDPGAGGMVLVLVVATSAAVLGKITGTALPLRLLGGLPTGEALVVGAFMQCKGLMEIVVLTMLKDAQIIAPGCFSAMILGTLVTTAATKPLVGWLKE